LNQLDVVVRGDASTGVWLKGGLTYLGRLFLGIGSLHAVFPTAQAAVAVQRALAVGPVELGGHQLRARDSIASAREGSCVAHCPATLGISDGRQLRVLARSRFESRVRIPLLSRDALLVTRTGLAGKGGRTQANKTHAHGDHDGKHTFHARPPLHPRRHLGAVQGRSAVVDSTLKHQAQPDQQRKTGTMQLSRPQRTGTS